VYTPTFAELAGPEEEFFSTYFSKAPLYRPAALKTDPRQLLSLADLDTLLHFEAIRPPYIRIVKDGDGVLDAAFTTSTRVQSVNITDAVVPERVYELLRTGATITWNSVNHFHSGLRELTRMLATKFAIRSDVVAFLTPAGKQGFTPHHDPVDLFIIQLEGIKHWKLWKPPAIRRGEIQLYKESGLGEPVIEVTLQPGDVLYLPYGTPHVATADQQVSLHLSVMVRPRIWSDLLRLTVDRLVEDEPFWQFPYMNEATAEDQAKVLADRVALLARRLRATDPAAELRRLVADGQRSPGSSQGGTFQEIAAIDSITPATRLRRTGLEVLFTETTDGKTKTKVNGHTVAIPEPVAASLQEIGAGDIAAGKLFPGAGEQRSASAAQALTRLGILTVIR
jgi:ribosomal protein L16 Arg81 hydroxylase